MGQLNWDYTDKFEDMLAVIEGSLDNSGVLTRSKLLYQSLTMAASKVGRLNNDL